MDDLDRAKEYQDMYAAMALARHQAASAQPEAPLEKDGRRLCVECLWEIPAERVKAAPQAVRCTECQNDFELQQRR